MILRSGTITSGNIRGCDNCVLCGKHNALDKDPKYINHLTGEEFYITDQFNCNSQNIIYLISCKEPNCNMQYVGRTISKLKKRLSGHRSGLLTGNEPKHVLYHFTKKHKPSDMIIKPIDVVKDNENINDIENDYILKLNTLYPYGLNDRLEKPQYLDAQNTINENGCIFKLFPKIKLNTSNNTRKRGKGTNKPEFNINSVYNKILNLYNLGYFRSIKSIIASLNIKRCGILCKYICEKKATDDKYNDNYMFYDMSIDLCNHYRYKNLNFKEFYDKIICKDRVNNDFVPIYLVNKNVDSIGLNNILNSSLSYFPTNKLGKKYSSDDFRFNVCYRYSKPIRNNVYNYHDVVSDTDDDNVKCYCGEYSEFIDKDKGHVLTGNLKIINNRKIRNLLCKGSKFIETLYCSKKRVLTYIERDLDTYIKNIAERYNINVKLFVDWKQNVMCNVNKSITDKNLQFNGKCRSVLETNKIFWEDFKNKFVMCPVDKAGNNISIICKKYYVDNIETELNTTDTYDICNETECDIVRNHEEFCENLGIDVEDKSKKLPILYMMPKFHKSPVGARYIAASVSTSLKLLSKILSPILKSILEKMKYKVNYEFKFNDTSGYWVADNNFNIRKSLDRLSNMNKAHNINSFDFKTLYTNIPHRDLFQRVSTLIDEMFELKKSLFVNVRDNFRVSWGNKCSGKYSFTCSDVKDMLEYLLDNIYVKFRGKIFKQNIGVPMGCDCAPFLANLYLFSYEYDYIKSLDVVKHHNKCYFRYCSRYIDDLCIPNGLNNFLGSVKDIYPDCLVLEKTNEDDQRVTFLDLDISICNKKFEVKLYDKRNDFDFNVVSMPNMSSNIPEKQTYGIFYGQLFRLCNVNSKLNYFVKDVNILMNKLIHQNFDRSKLLKYLKKFIKSNHPCTFKYWNQLNMNMFV